MQQVDWALSPPVNCTPETTSAPSFRKLNLWPLRSSWICTSDQGDSITKHHGEAWWKCRSLKLFPCCLCHTRKLYIYRDTHTNKDMLSQISHYSSFCAFTIWRFVFFLNFDVGLLLLLSIRVANLTTTGWHWQRKSLNYCFVFVMTVFIFPSYCGIINQK